jgi:hypothetical protein
MQLLYYESKKAPQQTSEYTPASNNLDECVIGYEHSPKPNTLSEKHAKHAHSESYRVHVTQAPAIRGALAATVRKHPSQRD